MSTRLGVVSIGLCGLVAAAVRLPFVWTGISPDEGGYAYIAERWASGARLYGDAWVDRPQGLVLAYRAVLGVAHEPWAIRSAAVAFGVAITLLLGVIGWLLRGPAAGIAAAAIFAVVGAGTHIEGFTFNGELIAALPATAAVTAAVLWRRSRSPLWLVAAGLAGATAILMKQSGFDGLVAAIVAAALWARDPRERLRGVAAVGAGASVPLAASVVHGLVTGWHDYWFALVEYRFATAIGGNSVVAHRRVVHVEEWAPKALRDLWVLAALGLAAVVVLLLRRRADWIALAWLAAAFVGVNLGGAYWPHYFVQLVPPLALVVALAAAELPRPVLPAAVAASMLPVAVFLGQMAFASHAERVDRIQYYDGYEVDRRVAGFLRRETRPGEPTYVLQSRADIYFLARRTTPYPYLWSYVVHHIEGAAELQRKMLAGTDRPRVVLSYYDPHHFDRTGRLERDLAAHYCFDGRAAGTYVRVFRRAKTLRDGLVSVPARRRC